MFDLTKNFKELREVKEKLLIQAPVLPYLLCVGFSVSICLSSYFELNLMSQVIVSSCWLLGLFWARKAVCLPCVIFLLLSLIYCWNHRVNLDEGLRQELGQYRRIVEVEGYCLEGQVEGLDYLRPRKTYMFQVTRVKVFSDSPWKAISARVILTLPFDSTEMFQYGESLQVLAEFSAIERREGAYSNYLKTIGVSHFAEIQAIVKRRAATGVKSWKVKVLKWRTGLLQHLTKVFSDEQDKKILSAILFAEKGGLSAQDKERYLRSGSLHVFAVSGLHVGFCASIIFILLKLLRVPFRWRYALLPILLIVYVFFSGMGAAAVRAWLMISIWSMAKSLYWNNSPLNTVTLAAVVLLLIEPLYLFQLGFQFSFLIVYGLILIAPVNQKIILCLSEKTYFSTQKSWINILKTWMTKAFVMSFLICFEAWLLSLPLTLFYNQLLAPVAIFSNIVASFLVWFVFLLSFFVIVGVPFTETLLSITLSALDNLVSSDVIQSNVWDVSPIAFPLVLLICSCIFYLIIIGKMKAWSFALLGLYLYFSAVRFTPEKHRVYLHTKPYSNVPELEIYNDSDLRINKNSNWTMSNRKNGTSTVLIADHRKGFWRKLTEEDTVLYLPIRMQNKRDALLYFEEGAWAKLNTMTEIQSLEDEFTLKIQLDKVRTLYCQFTKGNLDSGRNFEISLYENDVVKWKEKKYLLYQSHDFEQSWIIESTLSSPK